MRNFSGFFGKDSRLVEVFSFLSIGSIATVVHAFIYSQVSINIGMDAIPSNLIAFTFAFFISFTGHYNVTFRTSKQFQSRILTSPSMIKFLIVAITGLLMNTFFVWLLVEQLSFGKIFALIPMLTIVPPLTYLLSKYWAFSSKQV